MFLTAHYKIIPIYTKPLTFIFKRTMFSRLRAHGNNINTYITHPKIICTRSYLDKNLINNSKIQFGKLNFKAAKKVEPMWICQENSKHSPFSFGKPNTINGQEHYSVYLFHNEKAILIGFLTTQEYHKFNKDNSLAYLTNLLDKKTRILVRLQLVHNLGSPNAMGELKDQHIILYKTPIVFAAQDILKYWLLQDLPDHLTTVLKSWLRHMEFKSQEKPELDGMINKTLENLLNNINKKYPLKNLNITHHVNSSADTNDNSTDLNNNETNINE